MKNQIGWRKNNNKRNVELLCPEWLWIAIFFIIFVALTITATKMTQIEPETVKEQQTSLIEPESDTAGQILPNKVVVGIDNYVDGDQEPRYQIGIVGIASWYDYSLKGDTTGNEWSKRHDTCATRGWLRYGKLLVTNLDNGKSVECYVNDDGPRDCEYRYKYKLDKPGECVERIIDLSSHAFNQIADQKLGLINVKIEEL